MTYSFGRVIKELRNRRGLTQLELAENLNKRFDSKINKGMVSKWENDIDEPRLETARQLALFFNTSLDYILGIEEEVETIAAHHEGNEWSEDELKEIEDFKNYVRSKRKD